VTVFQIIESNNLTRQSLELTRKDLELQYRPAIYLEKVTHQSAQDPNSIVLYFQFKNYGMVAAKDIQFSIIITEERKLGTTFYFYKSSVEGILPPQGEYFRDKVVSKKDLKEEVFAHIFISYTGVSELSETQRNYHALMETRRMIITEQEQMTVLKTWDLDWDEKPMKGPLPDSVKLYYEEKGLKMDIFR